MNRTRIRVIALVASAASACSSFTGIHRDSDAAGADAMIDSVDAPQVDTVSSDGNPRDDGSADADAGAMSVCGVALGACDPVANTGCPSGQDCITAAWPSVEPFCGTAGTAAYLDPCDVSAGQHCSAGLQCVRHRCIPLCCRTGGDAQCGVRGGLVTRCSIVTGIAGVGACTVPGECDYVLQQGCGTGVFCYATSEFGQGACQSSGSTPLNASCRDLNECTYGATCAGAPLGSCHTVCNPSGVNSCGTGSSCQNFSDRPTDYGYCR